MNLNQYPTLICSLPPLPADFEQPHVPISRPRLEDRLQMLADWEVDIIRTVEKFWRWESEPDGDKPSVLYEKLIELSDKTKLEECINVLADIRMLTVAVRSKIMEKKIKYPVGQYGHYVIRNWMVPDFGLGLRFPWLAEFRNHLENRRYTVAERLVCRLVWQEMAKIADRHHFDLTTVVTYLVRWDLINRWAIRDREKGLDRFNTLVKEAIGDYAGQIE